MRQLLKAVVCMDLEPLDDMPLIGQRQKEGISQRYNRYIFQ